MNSSEAGNFQFVRKILGGEVREARTATRHRRAKANSLARTGGYVKVSDMKIVSIREISRHFTRHAKFSREGEDVRVYRSGKPYVRIVRDEEAPPDKVPRVNFAARAKKDFGERRIKTNVVKQI